MLRHNILEKLYMNENMEQVAVENKYRSVRAFTEVIENIASLNPMMPIGELIDDFANSNFEEVRL